MEAQRSRAEAPDDYNTPASRATIERATALKFYMRQHYQDLLAYVQERRARMRRVHEQVSAPGLSAMEKATIYGEHCEKETGVLRMRRVRPKLRDFEMLALIGRGGFGEVYLCRCVSLRAPQASLTANACAEKPIPSRRS